MMRYHKNYLRTLNGLLGLALTVAFALPMSVQADPLDLATIPLANSPTVVIQPNLLFVLDDSGSMGWDYMPDYVNDSPYYPNDMLFKDPSFNVIAYNPAVRYIPPAYFDAGGLNVTKYPSQIGADTATGADSTTKPNWKRVKKDAYLSTTTSNLEGNVSFYTVVPGEYCTKPNLKICNAQSAASSTYPYPAPVRWCDNSTNANAAVPAAGSCQGTRLTGFTTLRTPSMPSYKSTITITSASGTPRVEGITIGGKEIMSVRTSSSNTTSSLAGWVADNINNCTNNTTGNCDISGYSAISAGNVVIVSAPTSLTSAPATPVLTSSSGTLGSTVGAFAYSTGTVPGTKLFTQVVSTNNSYPYPGSVTKATSRTDCAGATCTYKEEMTNYANYWAYYRTRMQMMKTAAGLAFKDIGEDYRVGFMTIHPSSTEAVNFSTFNTAQKSNWYNEFYSTSGGSATPLRSALATAGRIYAKKETVGGVFTDPMEYQCQQNFTLLTTDGFWNTDSESNVKDVAGAQVGNRDGGTTPRPYYEGGTASTNSLADVAKYYYDTDIRAATFSNCTGALGINVCEDPAPSTANQKQNMVTLTLGLGVDGTLAYTTDYKTATDGDFADIKAGTNNWPKPVADQPSAIDDLWHAAVNGGGAYFSAKNPDDLVASLREALASIKVKVGAATAAATSTLNPVSGDNDAFVASYTTGQWKGNLERRAIDTVSGEVSIAALACVEDVVNAPTCTAPSSVVANGSGGYDCVTPGITDASACSGVFDAIGSACKVALPVACNGVLKSKVAALTDTRTIKMNNGTGSLVDFNYSSVSAAGLGATFATSFLQANLTQWASLTTAQQANVTSVNLANYLRGQNGFDESAADVDKRVFRKRQAVLGDAVDSKPAFIGKPTFNYADPGYADFKTAQDSRAKTVYMGANDGMLHAFDATSLQERWAYVPSMVIPNMWKLADTAYANKHSFYVNGDPVISDVCVSACTSTGAVWKTILVAGLNGGGRGYYALDITNPSAPSLLWELDANDESNLGYTFGNPIITKRSDGKWVVLVTSGYNNIPDNSAFYALSSTKFKPNNPAMFTSGNGQGYLYVLDATTGTRLSQIGTGAGSASTPSGLAKIKAYADDAEKNNTTKYVYGGDLLGNLWRFNIEDNSVMKFAQLEASGQPQPITTAPELGLVNNKPVVFVGTGKYLEVSDLLNTDQQTLYAIKDDNASSTVVNPRSSLVQQTIVANGADNRQSGTSSAVDFSSGLGWYVDLPDSGERQNVNARLVLGTLLVPTTVPTSSACQPAGYGWFNYFDYKTGLAVVPTLNVSTRTSAPTVGFNVVYIDGKPKVSIVTADDPTPKLVPEIPFSGSGTGFQQRRSIWREIVD